MNSFNSNINEVYKIISKFKGKASRNNDIQVIETLNGTYTGKNVLEGFRVNTQIICSDNEEGIRSPILKMCREDNMVIIDLTNQESFHIPSMTIDGLKFILFSKLKLNKACDIYKLTVEHLRFLDEKSLHILLQLLNSILLHLNSLSS